MCTRLFLIILLSLLSLLGPTIGNAEIFKYIDQHGAVAFTDNIEKVPEAQRPQIQMIEPASPPVIPPPIHFQREHDRWIDHPLSKYILAFIGLAIFMLYVHWKTKSFLLRLAVKLLFVGLLGAAIYSVLLTQKGFAPPLPVPKMLNQKLVPQNLMPMVPNLASIEKAKKAVDQVEAAQKREEAVIESLMPSGDK